MSVMSELHSDLTTIHQILLDQRRVAQDSVDKFNSPSAKHCVACIDIILLNIESEGVKWPDDVTEACQCGGDKHPEHGPWG